MLSVPILLKTFFKPLKNEYRDGLVWFSIIMGMLVKSVILFVDFVILLVLFFVLLHFVIAVFALPVLLILFIINK